MCSHALQKPLSFQRTNWQIAWKIRFMRLVRCFSIGCFPLFQRFRKFRSKFKWKSPFRFLPTGIFGITSGGGPLISVGIFQPQFAVPFLTNRSFALIREFGKGINRGKSHSYWLGRFNRKSRSIFLGYSHWSLTDWFGVMESTHCLP